MAPSTRRIDRTTPPIGSSSRREFNTPQKTRFYEAYDRQEPGESHRSICRRFHLHEATARLWLRQRRELGLDAYRHTRQLSNQLGRRSKVSNDVCQMLVSPDYNPYRQQRLEAQIEHFGLDISRRRLQTRILKSTKGGETVQNGPGYSDIDCQSS